MSMLESSNGVDPIGTDHRLSDLNRSDYLTRPEVATRMGVSVTTVKKYIDEGRLSYVEGRGPTGHTIHLVPRRQVEDLIRSLHQLRIGSELIGRPAVPSGPIATDRTPSDRTPSDRTPSDRIAADPIPTEPDRSEHPGSDLIRWPPGSDQTLERLHGAQLAAKLQALRAKEARQERDQLLSQNEFLKEQLTAKDRQLHEKDQQLADMRLMVAKWTQMVEATRTPALPPTAAVIPVPKRAHRFWPWGRR